MLGDVLILYCTKHWPNPEIKFRTEDACGVSVMGYAHLEFIVFN